MIAWLTSAKNIGNGDRTSPSWGRHKTFYPLKILFCSLLALLLKVFLSIHTARFLADLRHFCQVIGTPLWRWLANERRKGEGIADATHIHIWKNGKTVYTEVETLEKCSLAKDWAQRRESELNQTKGLEQVRHRGIIIGQVLTWYRDDFHGEDTFGRSKLNHINYLINNSDFSDMDAIELTSGRLDAYIHTRRRSGVGASTANNDLIWLRNASCYGTIMIINTYRQTNTVGASSIPDELAFMSVLAGALRVWITDDNSWLADNNRLAEARNTQVTSIEQTS